MKKDKPFFSGDLWDISTTLRMGLSDEEQDSMGGSTAVMDGQMKTQIKKAKQLRGTAKGKFTRKIVFFLECENKADKGIGR